MHLLTSISRWLELIDWFSEQIVQAFCASKPSGKRAAELKPEDSLERLFTFTLGLESPSDIQTHPTLSYLAVTEDVRTSLWFRV